jgi:hypothetical protein
MQNLPHQPKAYPKPPTDTIDLEGFDAVLVYSAEIINIKQNIAVCSAEGDRKNLAIFEKLLLDYGDKLFKARILSGQMLDKSKLEDYSDAISQGINISLMASGLPSRASEPTNPTCWEIIQDNIMLEIAHQLSNRQFTKAEMAAELNSELPKIEYQDQ